MEEYIKDAVIASNDEILLEAYDKEWALRDEGLRDVICQEIEQNKLEIVYNMLKENRDLNLISKITGLNLEKINSIKNKEC